MALDIEDVVKARCLAKSSLGRPWHVAAATAVSLFKTSVKRMGEL